MNKLNTVTSNLDTQILKKIILLFSVLTLIVDMANGWLLMNGVPVNLSIPFKFIFTVVLALGLSLINIKKFVEWMMITFALLILNFFGVLLEDELLIKSLLIFKFCFWLLAYYYFSNLIESGFTFNFKWLFSTGFVLLIINVLSSYVGIGKYEDFGSRATGLVFAPNELSYTALTIMYAVLLSANRKKNRLKFYVLAILSVLISFLMGLKVTILGLLLLLCVLILKSEKKYNLVMITSLLALAVVLFGPLLFLIIEGVYTRTMLTLQHRGLMSAIFSGRIEMAQITFDSFLNSELLTLLFGFSELDHTEMDMLIVLFNTGFLGFILIYILIIYLFVIKTRRTSPTFYVFIILSASSLAGHFIFSAMAGFFFACFIVYYRQLNQSVEKNESIIG